jgi:predicted MPP superfamily phosphohydrolase
MLQSELIAVALFVAAVGAVFVRAALGLVRIIRRTPLSKADYLSVILAVIGVGCVGYGYFVEPYRLTTTHVEIETAKLPAQTGPIRLVHLSDLHSDPVSRLETELPDAVAAQKPDVIVFTGDSINSPAGLPVFQEALKALARIAPTFVVKGNWDRMMRLPVFDGTGAHELNGKAQRLMIRGAPIWLAGLSDGNEAALGGMMRDVPAGEFSVLLYHRPDLPHEAQANRVDLYCAGHTHGGQVALPLYGALITLSRFGKKYESGLYRESRMWMYVNRGVGMEGGIAPRVRFWSPPEITVIDINSTARSARTPGTARPRGRSRRRRRAWGCTFRRAGSGRPSR